MRTREELIRRWLRGKGFHPLDIQVAIEWHDQELKAGRKASDKDVLAQAEQSQKNAGKRDVPPTPVVVRYEMYWRVLGAGVAGGIIGGALWDLATTLLR